MKKKKCFSLIVSVCLCCVALSQNDFQDERTKSSKNLSAWLNLGLGVPFSTWIELDLATKNGFDVSLSRTKHAKFSTNVPVDYVGNEKLVSFNDRALFRRFRSTGLLIGKFFPITKLLRLEVKAGPAIGLFEEPTDFILKPNQINNPKIPNYFFKVDAFRNVPAFSYTSNLNLLLFRHMSVSVGVYGNLNKHYPSKGVLFSLQFGKLFTFQ